MIAGGACYTSAGGQKGLKALGAGPSAGASDCAHKAGMGLTKKLSRLPKAGRLERRVSALLGDKCNELLRAHDFAN